MEKLSRDMAQCIMELESVLNLSKLVAEARFDLVWLSIRKHGSGGRQSDPSRDRTSTFRAAGRQKSQKLTSTVAGPAGSRTYLTFSRAPAKGDFQ